METNLENSGLNFYRIKTEWVAEQVNGMLNKTKTEELVYATSYTEAEKVAYAIVEDQNRAKYGSINIEIIKTKIDDVLFNEIFVQDDNAICGMICNFFEEGEDSGCGLYSVKVINIMLDEKTGKEKRTAETFYVPAVSNVDASKRIDKYMSNGTGEYLIRDTKFDKAEAIYWPKDVHQSKVNQADLK